MLRSICNLEKSTEMTLTSHGIRTLVVLCIFMIFVVLSNVWIPSIVSINGQTYHNSSERLRSDSVEVRDISQTVTCSHTQSAKTVPFIWDNKSRNWYSISVSQLPRFTSTSDTGNTLSFGSITVDRKHITGLEKNVRNSYRMLGKILKDDDKKQLMEFMKTVNHTEMKGRIATFQNVVISANGWIVNTNTCSAVRNGGCPSINEWKPPKSPVKIYDRVISLAAYWGGGIWHFLLETLVGLAHISGGERDKSLIHISSKNNWSISWLQIVGIPSDKLITGTIKANTLLIPEMGRCGTPSVQHINWLQSIIPVKQSDHPKSVLLIKRTRSRVLDKFDKIQNIVQKFAEIQHLQLVVHDDSSLPLIQEQLQRFADASIVIGPHGAGMVNLIASKRDTCVIEFMPIDPNICYMRLSYVLGFNYFAIPLYNNKFVDLIEVERTLNLCKTNE